MESNNNLFKFGEILTEAMGIESLVLKEDEIVSFLKKYQYITPYDESIESNNNQFKFSEMFCEAMGVESLVLEGDDFLSFLKNNNYITPYDESKDRYVVTKIQDAQQQMSTKLCKFFGVRDGSVLTKIEIISDIMDYIKERNLQNPDNKNEFIPDEKLKELFSLSDGQILTHRIISSGIKEHISHFDGSRIVKRVHEVVYKENTY